jgi:hypothetical protein
MHCASPASNSPILRASPGTSLSERPIGPGDPVLGSPDAEADGLLRRVDVSGLEVLDRPPVNDIHRWQDHSTVVRKHALGLKGLHTQSLTERSPMTAPTSDASTRSGDSLPCAFRALFPQKASGTPDDR